MSENLNRIASLETRLELAKQQAAAVLRHMADGKDGQLAVPALDSLARDLDHMADYLRATTDEVAVSAAVQSR